MLTINKKHIVSLFLLVGALNLLNAAHSTSANFMDESFETIIDVPQVNKIEYWEQPRTQYTPKNLVGEKQVRVSGSDTNGRNAYSYTMNYTDYDTKITGSYRDGDKYFIKDNLGRSYQTGEAVDLRPINKQISNLKNEVDYNSFRINKLNDRLEGGLATVSALTALHPNPRSNEKLEVAIGTGIYADNVAGAIGLFYHPNNRVMLSIGASYGGDDQFAGNFGITFGIGGKRK